MEKFQLLLDELAHITGLDSLKAEDDGGCAIQLDNIIINMQYFEETRQCYLLSRLFSIPANTDEKNRLYEKLLTANCFFRETGGGIIGIDGSINAVTYAVKFDITHLHGSDFASFIENFINTAEELIGKFSLAGGGDDPPQRPEDFSNYLRV